MPFRFLIAGVFAVCALTSGPVSAQTPELQIRADKGGYSAGEAATVTVTGLTECANRTVTLGMRGAARGQRFAAAQATLDARGNGSVRVALMSDDGGSPVQPAAWADCVDRGFEPGLALDPHPQLISVSFLSETELAAFLPAGAGPIAQAVARGDVEAIVLLLATGDIIGTGYPGDGGPLPHDTAVSQLRQRPLPVQAWMNMARAGWACSAHGRSTAPRPCLHHPWLPTGPGGSRRWASACVPATGESRRTAELS